MSRVTVGVPVYRGSRHIAATLRSIQVQSHRDIAVIVSLDGPDLETEARCRPFLEDPRFRLEVQPRRLGWVENVNWLLARLDTPFWCYQPQDDLMSPRYLEVLIEHAHHWPGAAATFCDIRTFGNLEATIVQTSVTGSPVARQEALLLGHHSAVAFRGLTRSEAARGAGGVRANAVEDFSADTAYMAAIARFGELRRAPAALYSKRYHDGNAHVGWARWPLEKRARGWAVHCADMLEQAMLVEATLEERRGLWRAAAGRLTAPVGRDYLPRAELDETTRSALLEGFLRELREVREVDVPVLLDASPGEVCRLAEAAMEEARFATAPDRTRVPAGRIPAGGDRPAVATTPEIRSPGQLAREAFEALLARRDIDAVRPMWTESSVDHLLALGLDARGPEQLAAFFRELHAAIPDLEATVENVVEDERHGVVQWRMTGTFDGAPFQGFEPTGARIELRGVDVARFTEEGTLDENTIYYDGAEFARQVGMLPRRDSAAERALLAAFNASTRLRRRLRALTRERRR